MPDTDRSKRILIFSLAYYPVVGGAEVAIKEITDRIGDTRLNDAVGQVEFDMVTLRMSAHHPTFERVGNVNVYRIGGGLGYLSKIFFIPRAALFAERMQKTRRYRAWWAMMSYMTLPVTLAYWFGTKVPYILTLQDGDPFEHVFARMRIRIFKSLLIKGFTRASVVQTISHFLADWARTLGYKGRIEVIPNGVNTKSFERRTPQAPHQGTVLITTSRLVGKNGIGDVIDALVHLPESVRFKILGTGPLEHELEAQVKRLNLESRVDFLGFVPQEQIPNYLHNADIFIRPSLSEGMGNSFIEAFAASLPVIATPVGGIPDFLIDNETGLFVPVHNPQSIAKQVKRLMDDKNLRSTLITNARELALRKYDWNLVAESMKKKVFEPFL